MKFLTFFKDDKAFANVYTGIFQKMTCFNGIYFFKTVYFSKRLSVSMLTQRCDKFVTI